MFTLTPVFAFFPVFLLLHELRERLRDRRLIRQDVEHPAPLERRTDDLLVELGRDVDATVGDAVVVRRWGCQAFDASFGRDARRGRVDGDRGIVVHPQYAPGVDRWTETAHEATGRRRSEARRVGEECVSQWRFRWGPD